MIRMIDIPPRHTLAMPPFQLSAAQSSNTPLITRISRIVSFINAVPGWKFVQRDVVVQSVIHTDADASAVMIYVFHRRGASNLTSDRGPFHSCFEPGAL